MGTLRARLVRQLRRDEGEVLHAYKDSLGYLTIGVGRLIDKRKGGGISKEESEYLLLHDIEEVETGVHNGIPWFDQLSEARQGVLLNMAFQMGVEGLLKFERTLEAIRDEHYAHAANLMLQSKWAKQTPERARRLSRQMETDEWQ